MHRIRTKPWQLTIYHNREAQRSRSLSTDLTDSRTGAPFTGNDAPKSELLAESIVGCEQIAQLVSTTCFLNLGTLISARIEQQLRNALSRFADSGLCQKDGKGRSDTRDGFASSRESNNSSTPIAKLMQWLCASVRASKNPQEFVQFQRC